MNFCQQCGAKNEGGALFCASCGAKLAAETKAREEQQHPVGRAKGKPVLKVILYLTAAIGAIFILMVAYALVTDKNSKDKEIAPAAVVKTESGKDKTVQTEQQRQQQPQQPISQSGSVRVTGVNIGYGFDRDKYKITESSDALQAARLQTLHAVVYLEGIKQQVTVYGEWVYLGTRESILTEDVTLAGDGAFHFELSKPSKGWPAGEYALKVYVNGREITYRTFAIR